MQASGHVMEESARSSCRWFHAFGITVIVGLVPIFSATVNQRRAAVLYVRPVRGRTEFRSIAAPRFIWCEKKSLGLGESGAPT